jgi:ElaB/YqjD/DUF883 family membrane-anchored ribosome-binding protein
MPGTKNTGEKIAGTAQQVAKQELDTVEEGVDNVIDTSKEAVHELRIEAEDIIDQAFNRFRMFWDQQRPKVESYVASHPWLVLGSFLLIGYFISGRQRGRRVEGYGSSYRNVA